MIFDLQFFSLSEIADKIARREGVILSLIFSHSIKTQPHAHAIIMQWWGQKLG
jgi:hypothetical protein